MHLRRERGDGWWGGGRGGGVWSAVARGEKTNEIWGFPLELFITYRIKQGPKPHPRKLTKSHHSVHAVVSTVTNWMLMFTRIFV